MANPSPLFFAMQPLQQCIFDKDDGTALAAGVVSYFSDPSFTTPKNIYEQSNQPDGSYIYTNIGSVVVLSSIGSFVDSNGENFIPFAFPWENDSPTPNLTDPGNFQPYYITVVSAGNVLQFTVTGWPANSFSDTPNSTALGTTANQITNQQFSEVLFSPDPGVATTTYSVSGTETIAIAPGWFVDTSGTGTVAVQQISLSESIVTEAPYALDIELSSGVTGSLYQRIYNSPRLLAGSFASGYLQAASVNNQEVNLQLLYIPSMGTPTSLASGTTTDDGNFTTISGTVSIPVSTPLDNANGYVDISLGLPASVHLQVTSFQFVAVANESDTPPFSQLSIPLQKSELFWYWQPALNFKPIKSMLTGWDFPLNPAQVFGPGTSGAPIPVNTTPQYVWDQLIMATATSTVNCYRTTTTGGFTVVNTGATEAFYMLQYLQGPQALETTMSNLSVNISAYTQTNPGVVARVYLYYSAAGGSVPTLPTSIGTIATTGIFTLTASNWSLVPQTIGSFSVATLSMAANTTTAPTDIGMSGWTGKTNYGSTATANFAIVVTFQVSTASTIVNVNSIALVPGDIPTRPAPQTAEECLLECSAYYQSSFPIGTIPANNTGFVGAAVGIQVSTGSGAGGPIVSFPVKMRVNPGVLLFNPTAASNGQIYDFTAASSWSASAAQYPGGPASQGSVNGFYTTGTPVSTVGHGSAVHWTADSRLGVV